jgi:two-component sensor histidine kinase
LRAISYRDYSFQLMDDALSSFTPTPDRQPQSPPRQASMARKVVPPSNFLLRLADILAPLAHPQEIQTEAARLLGEALNASRAAYFEVRDQHYVIGPNYTQDTGVWVGKYPLGFFGRSLFEWHQAGKPIIVTDVEVAHPPPESEGFRSLGIRAYLSVPLIKGGAFIAGITVHAPAPREWTPEDVAMAEETAERTWSAVERAYAERKQRQSEERLAAALRAGQLGVHEFEPQSGTIYWDATTRSIWGVAADAKITYETFASAIHPDDFAAMQAAVDKALDPHGTGRYEAVFRVLNRITKLVHWVRADGVVSFESLMPVRLVGTVQDITERIESSSALASSRERLDQTLEAAGAAAWEWEAGINQATWWPQNYALFGLDQAKGPPPFREWLNSRVVADDHERVIQTASTLLSHGPGHKFGMEFRINHPERGRRWISSIGRVERSVSGNLYVIGLNLDITERKTTEERLIAAHDTFRHLVERSPFGIYTIDADFRLTHVSQGAQKVFENVRPLIGRDFAEILRLIWPQPFADEAIGHFQHTLDTGESYHAPKTVERRADISAVEAYDWKIERIVMPDGRFGAVCHFYDLSERTAHEEKVALLMYEVNHRAKNMLALVDAVARQTASHSTGDFLQRFGERVRAIAASQDLLIEGSWEGASLSALIRSQLDHFKDLIGSRICLIGGPIEIQPKAAETLGMAFHELGTNAAKYGALSNSSGRVDIAWQIVGREEEKHFLISWRERDGPPVVSPSRTGFGQRIFKSMVERALSGEVELSFAPTGFSWALRCPATLIAS